MIAEVLIHGTDLATLIQFANDVQSRRFFVLLSENGGQIVVHQYGRPKIVCLIESEHVRAFDSWTGEIPIELFDNIDKDGAVTLTILKDVGRGEWLISINDGLRTKKGLAIGALQNGEILSHLKILQ